MTEEKQEAVVQDQKQSDKEYNFQALRKQLEQERQARQEAERRAAEIAERNKNMQPKEEEEDNYDEPYVDQKYLNRRMSQFERNLEKKYEQIAENKARQLVYQQKQETWLKQNPDFYEVMQHAEKFAQADPELAETILEMPEGFERQKLVYRTIKGMGLHKAKEPEPSIQQKIDANRRGPYYQPSNVGSSPYSAQGDFSPSGQKQAYEKLKELQSRWNR